MVNFWNSIVDLGPERLHYKVLVKDINLANTPRRETFAGTVVKQLGKMGYFNTDQVRMDTPERIDVRRLRYLLDRQADLLWKGLHPSRSCLSARAVYCRHYKWFIRPLHRGALRLHLSMTKVRAFLRFRLGYHDPPIDTGRRQGIPRDDRICTRCSLRMVGDEFNVLVICPLLEHIRSQFSHLFHLRVPSVTRFMWQQDGEGVARFVVNALKVYMNASGTSKS
eukprot:jgi/Botrbrau1/13461/Bobra.0082s0062.1